MVNQFQVKRESAGSYRGYPIFQETTIEYGKWHFTSTHYDKDYIKDRRVMYGFCVKGGNHNSMTQRFYSTFRDVKYLKEYIDRLENGLDQELTEKEYYNWVTKPNAKAKWGFSPTDLRRILTLYKKADAKRRKGYIERLDDANFHTEASLLADGDFDGYLKAVNWE